MRILENFLKSFTPLPPQKERGNLQAGGEEAVAGQRVQMQRHEGLWRAEQVGTGR